MVNKSKGIYGLKVHSFKKKMKRTYNWTLIGAFGGVVYYLISSDTLNIFTLQGFNYFIFGGAIGFLLDEFIRR